ncbi:FkbM family methyltransferase [Francisella philomiragia]|uniref:FkbM family methyltransferase n=1 Tax=Francisella philomiragia TaxID=28110 RepID=UPI00190755C4|nr:FkbM family methyltransferase [Francisella philomiragia]MBK2340595.1 FkbM family methyltransferase [Francisella philomiragia]
MYKEMSLLKKKLRGLSLRVFDLVENNGNCDFGKNGEENFINNLIASFKKSCNKKVVFDIGANVGNYSKMIKDKANGLDMDLHLFEPTKNCFESISEKFKDDSAIFLNNFGASSESGEAVIFYDREQSGLASLYKRNLGAYGIELNQSETIRLKRLEEYIEERNISHIDFIKIDIEGHELKAFEGFGRYLDGEFVDYIQFEYGGSNLDSHTSLLELYSFLDTKGFKVAKIMPKGLELRNYSPFMENFNYANYVAISKRIV